MNDTGFSRSAAARPALVLALMLSLMLAASGSAASSVGAPGAVTADPLTQSDRAHDPPLSPPHTRTADVVDVVHGREITDPYRWLEDLESEEVQSWIAAQRAYTQAVLDSLPYRREIRDRLDELFSIGGYGIMWLRGERLFFVERRGGDEQPILYVQQGDGEPRELVDPAKLREAAPIGLDWWFPSMDGRLVAYGISEGGSEQSTLHVLNVDTREVLPDRIPQTRHTSLAWEPDGRGFYYTRYPAPGDVPEGEEYYHRKVYHHVLGTSYQSDPMVFGAQLGAYEYPSVSLSTDGRFLIAYVYHGSTQNDIYVRSTAGGDDFHAIVEGEDARFSGIAVADEFFMMTYQDAPNGRILGVDLTDPDPSSWVELIPESRHTMRDFVVAGDHLLVHYLKDAHSQISVYTRSGEHVADVPLPPFCSVLDWTGEWRGHDVFIGVHSFLMPPAVYRYRVDSSDLLLHMAVEAPVDVAPYVALKVSYPSLDGTRISMFLVHRKDLTLDGDDPTLLTGYGGFGVSTTPEFARNRFLWLEQGGIIACPNLRGGGEYGDTWHRSGMLADKQNTFDDFIAAAEWLIENGYTSPERLAVWGESNGGLLVGAFVTQKPELARAAICGAPLLDMIRFHLFYGATIWTPEYGSPDDPEQFEWLFAYSPYHRVRGNTVYPAVMLTTGESDTRVHPSHAMKMAARLQSLVAPGRPVLLRFERQVGHGSGTPMSKVLKQYTDYFSFLMRELNVRPAWAGGGAVRRNGAGGPETGGTAQEGRADAQSHPGTR